MEIELITTKKKLSKSIIKQMNEASIDDMEHAVKKGKSMFYVNDVYPKDSVSVGIIFGANGWRRLMLRDWRLPKLSSEDASVYCRNRERRFDDGALYRDRWLKAFKEVKRKCEKNQVFI